MKALAVAFLIRGLWDATFAQDWKEVKTPPTRRDSTQAYELIAVLDPLEDPRGWRAASHDQSARAAVELGENRDGIGKGLRITYEFTGADRLEYVDISGNQPLPDETEAVGLWMRGGAHRLPARVRVVDAGGETHQFDLGILTPDEWMLGIAALSGGSHWGGDGNGKLDPPYSLVSILFDKLGSGFRAHGELQIAELGTYRTVPNVVEPHGIRVFIPADRNFLAYTPGEAIKLAATIEAHDAKPEGLLSARLVDPFGRLLRELTVPLLRDQPTPISLNTVGPGAYDVQLRLAGHEAEPGAPWADFRFAVMPPLEPTAQDRAFAVCTHFGQGWPLEVMPLIARAGIRVFRDEIYWGAVEREKGKLAIPDWCRQYIEEGVRQNLEPLIIADYANPHYDNGGFPVSPEARAGFARYAATLARALRPHLRLIEVWNEWCGGCGMPGPGRAEDYAPLVVEAAWAIREANPEVTVIGIGGEWDGRAFPQMMANGAGASMDAFSIHPYHYPSLAGSWLRDHLNRAREEAYTASGKPLPLWITEIGWPTQMDARGSDFLHQARCLVRTMVIALANGAQGVVWYDFKDDGLSLTYNEHNFGLVHHQEYLLAPKPAYVAYAHLIASVRGLRLENQELTSEGLWKTTYLAGGKSLTILFSEELEKRILVPVPTGARVEDMFGRSLASDGQIEVGPDPIFVFA